MKKNLYLFYGQEDFLISERLAALKERALSSGHNIETVTEDEANPDNLKMLLGAQSLFGGDKLVIIREPEVTAADQERFGEALKQMAPGVTAVFVFSKLDKRLKFFKQLLAQAEVFEAKGFAPWEERELRAWLNERATKLGKSLEPRAAERLREICGENLRQLAGNLEKIAVYLGEGKIIDEQTVEYLASPGEANSFALLEALRLRRVDRALNIFHVLWRNGEELLTLLGLIASQYRLMLQIKAANAGRRFAPQELNYSRAQQLARQISGSPFFISRCLQQINDFSLPQLRQALVLLMRTSSQMKGALPAHLAMELALTELCAL